MIEQSIKASLEEADTYTISEQTRILIADVFFRPITETFVIQSLT